MPERDVSGEGCLVVAAAAAHRFDDLIADQRDVFTAIVIFHRP